MSLWRDVRVRHRQKLGPVQGPIQPDLQQARVFTPADTSIPTPNSDTPYSFLWMDLRAEPLVLFVPKAEKNRYYSVEFLDLYTDTGAFPPPHRLSS